LIASSVVRWFGDGTVRGVIDGKYQNVKMPLKPYLFIPDVVAISVDLENFKGVEGVYNTDLVSVDTREKVYRVECALPMYVKKVRDFVEKEMGGKTFEADITYSRRCFIDKGFEVGYEDNNIMFLDVELDDSKGFRSFGEMGFLSFAGSINGKTFFHHIDDFVGEDGNAEWRLLKTLNEYIVRNGVSVIVGWNVGFDFKHFVKRVDVLRDPAVGRKGINVSDTAIIYCYDLRDEYRKAVKGLVSYSLDEVAKYEGLGGKVGREGKVSELKYDELREYNVRDVELLLEIEKKYGFVRRDMYLCREVNLPMDYAKVAGVLGDSIVLRRLRELGYVAPNTSVRSKKGYEGALILEPRPGLHERVLAMDVVSLYPTALLDLNVDILDLGGQVLPYYVAYFFRRKVEEEKAGNKVGRETYKILANAIYGLLGYERFRFFDERKAEAITKKGREVLLKMRECVESLGLDVVYGDTDSIFVKVDGVEGVDAIVDYVNSQVKPYRVAVDMVYDKIIFFGSEERGVKKRYIGVSGDKWKVRGIELRRGDWSEFSKMVLWDVVKMIFNGCSKADVMSYLSKVRAGLWRGDYDEKLKMVKSVRSEKQYKVMPAHFKLWKEGVDKGLVPPYSVEVEFYYKAGKGKGLNIGLWSDAVKVFDYKEYWEKQVMAPVKRVIESVWGDGRGRVVELENFI
jgi:DNA polymerase I